MVAASVGLAVMGACGSESRDSESDDDEDAGSSGASVVKGGRAGQGGGGGVSDGGEPGGGEGGVGGDAGRGGGGTGNVGGEGGETGTGGGAGSSGQSGSAGSGGAGGGGASGGSAGAMGGNGNGGAGNGGMAGAGGNPMPPAGSPVAIHGALHVDGKYLKNSSNAVVQLKGMSGYWTNWQTWHPEQNVSAMRWLRDNWGLSVVRLAMGVGPEDNGYLENPTYNRAALDAAVRAAVELGIYVIIDWHDHVADQHQAQAQAFFTSVATAYGALPNVLYETWNEPLAVSWPATVKPYHQALVQTIRAVDPDNVIILGSPNWDLDVDVASLDPVPGTNLMYTLHFYACTHGAALRAKAQAAVANGLPLFTTEWGATSVNVGEETYVCEVETDLWHDFLDANSISSTAWSLCNLQTEAHCIVTTAAAVTGGWDKELRAQGPYVRDRLQGRRNDCNNPRIIDTLEDANSGICPTLNRSGNWFVVNDGSGVQQPTNGVIASLISPARGTSQYGAHTYGSGFTGYGAILGLILRMGTSYPLYYDVSGYQGLRFHARGSGTARVGLTSGRTKPAPEGYCVAPACNRPFQTAITLTSNWVPFLLDFDWFRSGTTTANGAGPLTAADQRELLTIEFLADPGTTFDFWIDDIGFY
jgi:aryl-phospho-beta-D-glucosidase BglC (GH1 family)